MLPLSLPGVFAGSLLTFIPAAGDFINAEFLGGPKTAMIGNVVQDRFLVQLDYPTAAALLHHLMVIITVVVLIYARSSARRTSSDEHDRADRASCTADDPSRAGARARLPAAVAAQTGQPVPRRLRRSRSCTCSCRSS